MCSTDLKSNNQWYEDAIHFISANFSLLHCSQKAERDLAGLKRQEDAEAKMKRMLKDNDGSARLKVANAAASEGQRRSFTNKNNRFLVT